MTDATTVVFDFDLTLTRWDTADRFFRWLLKRDPGRLVLALAAAPILAPLLLSARTRRWPLRYAVWVATLGRNHEDLVALVREHADEVFGGANGVFMPDALERLRSHLDQGHRVVVATGCLEILARELLGRAGLADLPLVGSTLRPCLGGQVRHEHCYGPNKIPMLSARGFAPPWAVTYTDHPCDLPVLKLSAERYLINPKADAIALIERELAGETTILAWR